MSPETTSSVVGVADTSRGPTARVARAERLLLDRDRKPLRTRRRASGDDDHDERVRAERPDRLDHPVDHPAAEQRVQVLGYVGPHPRAQARGHDDGCEFAVIIGGWGARIRTWDRGTKTRCLTTWLRPTSRVSVPGALGTTQIADEVDERGDREQHDEDDREPPTTNAEDDHEHGHDLRRRDDPDDLARRRPSGGFCRTSM